MFPCRREESATSIRVTIIEPRATGMSLPLAASRGKRRRRAGGPAHALHGTLDLLRRGLLAEKATAGSPGTGLSACDKRHTVPDD